MSDRTPSRALEAGELDAPLKGNPGDIGIGTNFKIIIIKWFKIKQFLTELSIFIVGQTSRRIA